MKYAVVCYAIHDKDIASCDWFDDYESAQKFLEEDAKNTYEEEVSNCGSDDAVIDIEGNYAKLSSCEYEPDSYEYEYQWTWHIINY